SAELYDPTPDNWSFATSLTTGRVGHSATLLGNGKVLVAGGTNSAGLILSSAELYDPDVDSWQLTFQMPLSRTGHNAVLLPNGKVLIAGGGSTTHIGSPLPDGQTLLYDPSKPFFSTWSSAGKIALPTAGATLTALPDGRAVAAGGFEVTGRNPN